MKLLRENGWRCDPARPFDGSVAARRHEIFHGTRTKGLTSGFYHRMRTANLRLRQGSAVSSGMLQTMADPHRRTRRGCFVRNGLAMHRRALTRFPHLSWLLYGLSITPPRAFFLHEYTAVAHRLIITEEGDADFGWVKPEAVTARHVSRGDLSFCPADLDRHSLGVTTTAFYGGHVLLLPSSHLERLCDEEGVRQAADLHFIPAFRDPLLFASALRLVFAKTHGHVAEDLGAEIAARRLIIRLAAAAGGQLPAWVNDSSVFTPSRMRRVVERLDANLTGHLTLADMSCGFGLSPSHFARKFRLSTGLSLNRFMNRRRVGQALQLLITTLTPLAQLSLDLGFSSQSHFTHLFRSMTGLTPHQFRLSQRCMAGSSYPSRREGRTTDPSGEVPADDRSATVDPPPDTTCGEQTPERQCIDD